MNKNGHHFLRQEKKSLYVLLTFIRTLYLVVAFFCVRAYFPPGVLFSTQRVN